jgi:hypothetical protein
MIFIVLGWFLLSKLSFASVGVEETIYAVAQQVANPKIHLDDLVVLGSSSRSNARILLLPEVHNDPQSLLTQLLIIAQEQKLGKKLVFLGESIPALQKSPWELFSQKALVIFTSSVLSGLYSPKRFEAELKSIALKLKENPAKLNWNYESGQWVIPVFAERATEVYGWDSTKRASLFSRNILLRESIIKALKNADKVIVMLGARHVPELEYLSSLKLLCAPDKQNIKTIKQFFDSIRESQGLEPTLPYGIGATLPLYDFLQEHNYAVVFNKNLYTALNKAVNTAQKCVKIQ